MKNDEIRPDDVFYPVIMTPTGKVPLIGATMTDEKEREIASSYGVPFEFIVREKAQKAGLFLARKPHIYILQSYPSYKTVAKSKNLHELDKWLDAREEGRI